MMIVVVAMAAAVGFIALGVYLMLSA